MGAGGEGGEGEGSQKQNLILPGLKALVRALGSLPLPSLPPSPISLPMVISLLSGSKAYSHHFPDVPCLDRPFQ